MENYFKLKVDKTLEIIKRDIESENKDIELLKVYKSVMAGKDGKQFNKNVKDYRCDSYSFSLNKDGSYHYRLYLADYRPNLRYSKSLYLSNNGIAYVPEGKTNEVLNLDNLYKAVDEVIQEKLQRIEKLKTIDNEYLNGLCDEAFNLKMQVEELHKKFSGYGYFEDRFTLSELLEVYREFNYLRV